jgi:hypothetical protein
MPPRIITLGIIVFWLAMTGWLLQREIVPLMVANASPSYQPDLTDELGSPVLNWNIYRNGKREGAATSRVIPNDDRTFDFYSTYLLNGLAIGPVQFELIELNYKVSDEGKLRAVAVSVTGTLPILAGKQLLKGVLKGDVVDDEFEPDVKLHVGKIEEKIPAFEKVQVKQHGHFVNSMHLLNRLRGLREGRTWKISLANLTSDIKGPAGALFKNLKGPGELIAVVGTGTMDWDGRDTPCYKIEYREPGKDEIAGRTWVRKLDGLVLQQEGSQMGIDLVFVRVR